MTTEPVHSKKYRIMVIGGPAATGKTTVATNLVKGFEKYKHISLEYLEGDSLHPQVNVDKMAKGIPLVDEDRWGWLQNISEKSCEIAKIEPNHEKCCVVTCSSLKKKYREFMQSKAPQAEFHFVILNASREELLERMAYRKGHFMKANMIDSQLADLELPTSAEKESSIIDIGNKSVEDVDKEVFDVANNFFLSEVK